MIGMVRPKRANSTHLIRRVASHAATLPRRRFKRSDLVSLTRQIAERHGVRPALLVAQVRHESGFNPRIRSRAGAIGIAQIMPGTARAWHVNPRDPIASLHAMARNMQRYIQTYRQQGHDRVTAEKLALSAYNAGPHRVRQYGGVPPYRETRNYVRVILKNSGRTP